MSTQDLSDVKTPPSGGQLLTPIEAAAYIRRSASSLAKARVAGGGTPYYKVGRRVFYDRADLDAWLASRLRRSTSDAEK